MKASFAGNEVPRCARNEAKRSLTFIPSFLHERSDFMPEGRFIHKKPLTFVRGFLCGAGTVIGSERKPLQINALQMANSRHLLIGLVMLKNVRMKSKHPCCRGSSMIATKTHECVRFCCIITHECDIIYMGGGSNGQYRF